jgi:tight adherence protein B
MEGVTVVVFLSIFAIVALLIIATGAGVSPRVKQARAALDQALATDILKTDEKSVNLRKSEQLSGVPWLNRQLLKLELVPKLQTLLDQADLKWTVGTLLMGTAFCFALPAYLIYLRFDTLLFAFLIGVALGSLPLVWVLRKRRKRLNKFEEGLPEALEMMVSALRAGQSFTVAMASVARDCSEPLASEFKIYVAEQNYGLELQSAMENLTKRVPLQDLRIVVTAITIQKETGGNLAEVLSKTAYVIRERFRLKRQIAVHTAQGRLTGMVLTLLPVVLGIALYFLNPEMMSILWKNPVGVKLLWISSGMLVAGGLLIRYIVNVDV